MDYTPLTVWKKGIAGLLVCVFVAAPVLSLNPSRADAVVYNVIESGGNLITNIKTTLETSGINVSGSATAISTTLTSAVQKSLGLKEWTLDAIAWSLAKKMVSEIMQSTTRWISTGFQGSPMFVTDPGAFLLDIADRTAGDIIYGSDLNFLCSPINIKIALNFYYQSARNKRMKCSLTGIGNNIQQFIDGNFAAGGWPGFLSVSLTPINGNLGAAIAGKAYIDASIASNQGIKQKQWDWGKGFLGSEKCTGDGTAGSPKKCVTVTPGETISSALNKQLGVGQDSLIAADEINEMIGALFAQVLTQGLSAAQGIFGTSQPGSGSSGYGFGDSYTAYDTTGPTSVCNGLSALDQLNNPVCDPSLPSSANLGGAESGAGAIFASINEERTYQAMHQRVITATDGIIAEAKRRGSTCNINDSVVAEALQMQRAASSSIMSSQSIVNTLTDLQSKFENGAEMAKLQALTAYGNLTQSNTLHTSITNVETLRQVETTLQRITGDKVLAIAGQEDTNSLMSRIQDCPRTNNSSSTDNGAGTTADTSGGG